MSAKIIDRIREYPEAVAENERLRAQRDELVAALEEITSFLANQPRSPITDFIDRFASDAIAKAKE